MITIDWTLAVIIVSLLFCIGISIYASCASYRNIKKRLDLDLLEDNEIKNVKYDKY